MIKRTLIKTALLLLVVVGLTAVSATALKNSAAVVMSGRQNKLLPIYSVERGDKAVSITFDCAWGVDSTDKILSVMDEYGVKCTFFAVEFWVEKYPEYAKRIVEAGHGLGTHSATHSHMSKLSVDKIKAELSSSCAAIERVTGARPTLFRCPFGEYDDKVISSATDLGLYTIQWDVDSLDWKDLSAADIAARVVKAVRSGSIILCHNNGKHTAEALPLIFSYLKENGYKLVPVSELIIKTDYKINVNGRQIPLTDKTA